MSEKLKHKKTRAQAKKIEGASRKSKAGLEALQKLGISDEEVFDTLNDGIYIMNGKGHFAYVNRVIEERSGIPFDKFVRLHFLSNNKALPLH